MSVQSLMNVISFSEYIESAAAAFAALRLFHLGLHRTQAALTAYIGFTSFFLFALAWFPPASQQYFYVYVTGAILTWILATASVRQVFTLLLSAYAGIRTAARWCMYAAITISVAASLLVSKAAWREGPAGHSAILFYSLSLNRSVVLTLGLFIALFLILMSRYPLHLKRNTVISCGFFGALFLCEALTTLIDTLSPHLYSGGIDLANVSFSATCLFLWGVLLRRETFTPRKVTFNKANEDRLLQELETLNALLTRPVRK